MLRIYPGSQNFLYFSVRTIRTEIIFSCLKIYTIYTLHGSNDREDKEMVRLRINNFFSSYDLSI